MTPKPPKARPCKCCGTSFTPYAHLQAARACSPICAANIVRMANERKAAKAKLEERRADKVKKEAMKKRSEWIAEAQAAVNKVARLRDMLYRPCCISCGEPYRGAFGGAFDAGHMRSVGSAHHMRFWLPQINLQCVRCNRHLGGNAIEYRKAMVALRGREVVEAIECMQHSPKWTVPYLVRLKAVMSKKARRLEKRLAHA